MLYDALMTLHGYQRGRWRASSGASGSPRATSDSRQIWIREPHNSLLRIGTPFAGVWSRANALFRRNSISTGVRCYPAERLPCLNLLSDEAATILAVEADYLNHQLDTPVVQSLHASARFQRLFFLLVFDFAPARRSSGACASRMQWTLGRAWYVSRLRDPPGSGPTDSLAPGVMIFLDSAVS